MPLEGSRLSEFMNHTPQEGVYDSEFDEAELLQEFIGGDGGGTTTRGLYRVGTMRSAKCKDNLSERPEGLEDTRVFEKVQLFSLRQSRTIHYGIPRVRYRSARNCAVPWPCQKH